jgi:hypothetical protein
MPALDDVDFKILRLFWTNQERSMTTTALAKVLYCPANDYDLRKKDSLVRYRLRRLEDAGFLNRVELNERSCYTFDADKFFCCDSAVLLLPTKEKLVLKNVVVARTNGEITMKATA